MGTKSKADLKVYYPLMALVVATGLGAATDGAAVGVALLAIGLALGLGMSLGWLLGGVLHGQHLKWSRRPQHKSALACAPCPPRHLASPNSAHPASIQIAPLPGVPAGVIGYTAYNSLAEGDGR